MNQKIYDLLKDAARNERTVTYSEIAPLANLDMSRADHRNQIADILDEISLQEHRDGHPLLSAIVVHKEDQLPGDGFYIMARQCKRLQGEKGLFHAEELGRVFAFWKQH